jgi:acetyltransferase EpsM
VTGGRGEIPLVILGAGGHGAEIAAYARAMSLPLAGAFDDGRPRGPWHLTTVLGSLKELPTFCRQHDAVDYITAFGSNEVRRRIVKRVEALGVSNLRPATVRHSSAWTGEPVRIGPGCLLAPSSLVTTRATIGAHCILNVKASISHDCNVRDFCNLKPGATVAGDVRLGEGCYIGAGAVVLEKRTVGAWTVVGAGAVVTRDLPDGVTAAGVPARIIKRQGVPSLE